MEILNSGSFINLENQEKIEQLKFTATELANAAIETAGFVNQEEPARKLALEFWQGLDYMCRENERGTIHNIFTNQFLERLRELRPSAKTIEIAAVNDEHVFVLETVEDLTNSEDEFLGVIQTPESPEISPIENLVQTEDISPAEVGNNVPEIDFPEETQLEETESNFSETEVQATETEPPETHPTATEVPQEDAETQENLVPENLQLPEKEPYQFGKCTVTATIQLLPVEENSVLRRAVLSVKTHDFAPQISLVELSAADLTATLAPEIEKVFQKYQADLPFKVMDKMKKEKTAPKRSTPKVSTEPKSVSQATAKPKEVSASQNTPTTAEQTTLPAPPQPAETGMQGSLFAL